MNSFGDDTECGEMNNISMGKANDNNGGYGKTKSDIRKKIKTAKIILFVSLALIVALLTYIGIFIYRTVYDPQAAFEKQAIGEINPEDPAVNQNSISEAKKTTAKTFPAC